ncbi:MAG: hypothetical protein HZA01_14495 [Nitrospinae bacterium]|nr:hypothetical protein [Nitrospinota bacterium]
MEDIKTIVEKLNKDEIKAIKDAHSYTWSQTGILYLLRSYISDIRHDRINLLNMECRGIDVVRHFLSHNYTEKVELKKWDMQGDTIVELKTRHNDGAISFKYDGTKYFPELYNDKNKKFEINISFDLSKVSIGASLFKAISIKELFFLGELCNNSLRKLIGIINNQGMDSRPI